MEKLVLKFSGYNRVIILNYVIQRIFGNSNNMPYSVHFTSKLSGDRNGLIIEKDSLTILNSLAFSGGCYIVVHKGTSLFLGEGTIWAYGVSIVTGNHDLKDRNKHILKDVSIGKNCWLAKGVSVMPGVTLGDNVTVGANSVVTKSFPSNVVIAGVPAKVIKYLDIEE